MRRMCTLLSRKPVAWLWDSFATPWYKNWVKRDSKPSSSSVPVNWNRACLVNHSGAFPEDISASGSEIHTFTLWKPTEWITTTAPFKLLVGFNRRNMLVILDHQPKQRENKQDTWDQSLVGLIGGPSPLQLGTRISWLRLFWIGRLVCVRFPHYHVQSIRFGLTIMLHFHSFSTSLVEHSLALHFISETRNGQRLLQSAWNVWIFNSKFDLLQGAIAVASCVFLQDSSLWSSFCPQIWQTPAWVIPPSQLWPTGTPAISWKYDWKIIWKPRKPIYNWN